MIPNPEPSAKLHGWVVEYANSPAYKGTAAYLLVKDFFKPGQRDAVGHAYSITTCTIFASQTEAKQWAELYPGLLGEGHEPPEVRPVWSVQVLTLEQPGRDGRVRHRNNDIIEKLKAITKSL